MPKGTVEGSGKERLDVRLDPDKKRLIEAAATLEGVSITDFVVRSAADRAEAALERQRKIELSKRDQALFIAALLEPPEPNAYLVRAMRERLAEEPTP
jgi:uncharacterized protein (DUF1778 family)